MPPLNETYIEQHFAALLPLEGSFRLGEGLFDLLYFCSLMWYSPAITLICGQSQVKCIYHIHAQMRRLHWRCINTHKYTHHQKEMVSLQTSGGVKWICLLTGCLIPFQKLFRLYSFTAEANTSMLLLLCYIFQQVQSGNSFFFCQSDSFAQYSLRDKSVNCSISCIQMSSPIIILN